MSNSEKFSIDVVGDNTEQPWKGVFTTKLRLSHRDYLRQDELRRALLGENPTSPSPRAANTAELFSFIGVHIIDAPDWWKREGDGLNLEDDNVIGAVYAKIVEAKTRTAKKTIEQGEADLKKLEEEKK